MIKRSTPPLFLERSPLVYFIAQVRFADILALERHVPSIQDDLRQVGLPIFRTAIVQGLRVDPGGAATIENRQLWHFENVDATLGIVLTRDSVSLHTTQYDRFETTLPPFIDALTKLQAIVGINVLQRCGLRYVDVVHPNAGESFQTYLRPEIVGLSGADFGVEPHIQSSMFSGTSECGTLVVKFGTDRFPAVMPMDLMPVSLKVSAPIAEGELIGTLDFDHYAERQHVFTVARAQEILEQLHDASSRAFKACVTAEAFGLWGQQDAR